MAIKSQANDALQNMRLADGELDEPHGHGAMLGSPPEVAPPPPKMQFPPPPWSDRYKPELDVEQLEDHESRPAKRKPKSRPNLEEAKRIQSEIVKARL